MKKTICLALAAVLSLGLFGCGKTAETDSKVEKYDKYESLIEKIEAGDFAGAYTDLLGRFPAQEGTVIGGTTTSYKEVEITIDNWQEYFEIVPSEEWGTNGFGEADCLEFKLKFQLKDAYKDLLTYGQVGENQIFSTSEVTAEVRYNVTYYDVTVDFATQSYTKGGLGSANEYYGGEETSIQTFSFTPRSSSNYISYTYISPDSTDPQMKVWDNIEVLRIQGTLYLKDE